MELYFKLFFVICYFFIGYYVKFRLMIILLIGCYRFDILLNNFVLLDFKVKKYWYKNNDLIVIFIVINVYDVLKL